MNFSDIQAIHNWIINSDILSIYVLFQFEKERQHPSISWNTLSSPIFFFYLNYILPVKQKKKFINSVWWNIFINYITSN